MEKENLDINGINNLINKRSGMLGISGISSDMRDIEDAAWNKHNERAILALDMFDQRVKRYIGAFAAEIGGCDAIVFTGGIGENDPESREHICEGLEYMGVEFEGKSNKGIRGKTTLLSKPESKVKVVIIPTNEEKVIAKETVDVLKG